MCFWFVPIQPIELPKPPQWIYYKIEFAHPSGKKKRPPKKEKGSKPRKEKKKPKKK